MNIQETYTFLDNNFSKIVLEYFKKQVSLFKVEPTSKLKDYLDFIDSDPVHWLNSLPNDIQCKSAFHKYKEPIYKLIKHTKLHEDYGENYCSTILTNIKQAFSSNCQDIIDKRKTNKNVSSPIMFDDSSSDTENNHSSMDINAIEPVDKDTKQNTTEPIQNITETLHNTYELQKQLEILQHKLTMQEKYYETTINNLQLHHQTVIQYYQTDKEYLMKLLGQYASK